jgi:Lar family restriction alleviation protein
MNNDNKLKPCPFCGGEELQVKLNEPWAWVACTDCDAQGFSVFDSDYDKDNLMAGAIRKWNTRAPDQLVRDSEWQDIKTAPKDGSHIQLYRPEIEFVGYYSDNKRWVVNAPGLPVMLPSPTHWKPLSPPSTKAAKGGAE